MKLLQHAYGRVSRGYQGCAPGYQVAALSPELSANPEAIACLNRMSFYRGSGAMRYSFFRIDGGLLAMGRVCLSRDLTGATATFAHHYVCHEADFVRANWTPIQLLRALPYLGGEPDLPNNRVLPPIDVPEDLPDVHTAQRESALALLDRVFRGDLLRVPLLVAPDAELWPLLEAAYRLLPRAEAANLTFSTLFGQCADYVEAFRLVTVADLADAQSLPEMFERFTPSDLCPIGKPYELSAFWRDHPHRGDELLAFINCVRHGVPANEVGRLQLLVETGPAFRRVVECLEVTEAIVPLLLDDVNNLTAYWHGGAPLPYTALRNAIWARPHERLGVALDFTHKVAAFQPDLFVDIARQLSCGTADVEAFAVIERMGLATGFYEVCANRLVLSEIVALAEHLAQVPGYNRQLHHVVVRRLFDAQLSHDTALWDWVQRNQEGCPLAQAAVALVEGISRRPMLLPSLSAFTLSQQDARDILPWAWHLLAAQAGVQDDTVSRTLFLSANADFFALLESRIQAMSIHTAAACLHAIVALPLFTVTDERYLLELLQRHPNAKRLASALLGIVDREGIEVHSLRRQLDELVRRSRSRGWFDWMS